MEALYMKSQNPIDVPFLPITPIEYAASNFFVKGKSAAHFLNSMLMSEFGANEKENQTCPNESFYSEGIELNKTMYLWANNPTTSPTVLDHISTTSKVTVLEAVAMNESASKTTLWRLANHDSPLVRAAVTANSSAPFEILSLLSEDEHPDVRLAMAENPCISKSLLAKLCIDDNPFIADRACATLERLGASLPAH